MDSMDSTLALTKQLVECESITPEDAGCQTLIAERLRLLGFKQQTINYKEVKNTWLRLGTSEPLFVFAGHTDVVPPGPLDKWDSPPFSADIRDGVLYGRGTADMKGSIATMVTAIERFISTHQNHLGSIALLLTSDEEGPAIHGTRKVMEYLATNAIKIDWCLVGEPSSEAHVGDQVRIGRRGSLNGQLEIFGLQGHVAYPERTNNPIHASSQILAELCAKQWDTGDENFPPTSLQISNIHAGTGVENIIPGNMSVNFNFRFCPKSTEKTLRAEVESMLDKSTLNYQLDWRLSGLPFISPTGKLLKAVETAIKQTVNKPPKRSTGGGTSDGRFIAPSGAEVVELGPVNDSIHKVNEHVNIEELSCLSKIYQTILEVLLIKDD